MTNDDKYLNSDELREAIEKVGLPEGLNVYDATEGMRYWREEKDSLGRILQYPEMDNASTKNLLDRFDDPYEAIKDDTFKSINDPILAHNKVNNVKSVIHKNSRLGQVTNKVDESKQSLDEAFNKAGDNDQVGATKAYNKASNQAVEAVLDAVESK